MQTIYIDVSNMLPVPVIYAKKNDVGRRFAAIITDNGVPFDTLKKFEFSVWYEGSSGSGNYTEIGENSAFALSGNKIIVEMITQMLSNAGNGKMSLIMNSPDGSQLGLWNIPYVVEDIPGSNSEEATQYYTAFSRAVEDLPYPDDSLSIVGKAADAAATGRALSEKAPNGFGLGHAFMISENDTFDQHCAPGWYYQSKTQTVAGITANYWYFHVSAYGDGGYNCVQEIYPVTTDNCKIVRYKRGENWGDPEVENPPMTPGVEYRTTRKYDGKNIYTCAVDFGLLPNASSKTIQLQSTPTKIIFLAGYITSGEVTQMLPAVGYSSSDNTAVLQVRAKNSVAIKTFTDMSAYTALVTVEYTKD